MSNQSRFYPGQKDEKITALEREGSALARRAASAGMVLLENDGVLPLAPGAKVAVYGLGARHTIKGGTGSGDVNSRHVVSVAEGLASAGFEIVNCAYLDELDAAYDLAVKALEEKIYAAAGPEKNAEKLYDAHVRYTLETPSLPIPADSFADADILIYVISRTSGEGADRRCEPGDYLLTEDETSQLETLCKSGKKVVVLLNVGGIIDLGFMDSNHISALLLMGQAGCEAGAAAADVLSGTVNPSGCLTDSWAYHYLDYPSSENFSFRNGNLLDEDYTDGIYVGYRYFETFGVKTRYPFGYGLSYTTFEENAEDITPAGSLIKVGVQVTNTGVKAGAHVVQVYAACPAREQRKEAWRLVGFAKTGIIEPGATEKVVVSFDIGQMASYRAGTASYVLERGRYTLLMGSPERVPFFALELKETTVLQTLQNICEQLSSLREIEPTVEMIEARDRWIENHSADIGVLTLNASMLESCKAAMQAKRIPCQALAPDDDLLALAREKLGMLSEMEKVRLVVGAPGIFTGSMVGDSGVTVPGAAGETVAYPDKGVPGMVLADGPAGLRIQLEYEIREDNGQIVLLNRFETLENRFFGRLRKHDGTVTMYQFATAIPAGTLLAQSFDTALLEEVGEGIAREMKAFGVAMWLAPGMNIHRNPLCGRNFEYYSEDPLVSGLIAAAITKGVQRTKGLGTTIKHYACNNQEENRTGVSANISERALREVYLKGFEIAVTESQPMSIMTSYNRINYVHAANSYDLCTTVARDEWGFTGFIMTDWTTTNSGHGSSAAKCIRAGNDLVMPGRDSDRDEILAALHGEGTFRLTEEELDRCALRIIYAALLSNQALQAEA